MEDGQAWIFSYFDSAKGRVRFCTARRIALPIRIRLPEIDHAQIDHRIFPAPRRGLGIRTTARAAQYRFRLRYRAGVERRRGESGSRVRRVIRSDVRRSLLGRVVGEQRTLAPCRPRFRLGERANIRHRNRSALSHRPRRCLSFPDRQPIEAVHRRRPSFREQHVYRFRSRIRASDDDPHNRSRGLRRRYAATQSRARSSRRCEAGSRQPSRRWRIRNSKRRWG
ncbi:MAG: hypothetical protein QOE68_3865 [Thermoanaerobaculia bacterium]|nr:hypothetical protein [Thermoanaerobaculia bacterium]